MKLGKRNPSIAEYENNLKLKCNLKNKRPVRQIFGFLNTGNMKLNIRFIFHGAKTKAAASCLLRRGKGWYIFKLNKILKPVS